MKEISTRSGWLLMNGHGVECGMQLLAFVVNDAIRIVNSLRQLTTSSCVMFATNSSLINPISSCFLSKFSRIYQSRILLAACNVCKGVICDSVRENRAYVGENLF